MPKVFQMSKERAPDGGIRWVRSKKPVPSGRTPGRRGGADPPLDALYARVHAILTEARGRAWQAVNAAMVEAYWEIGRVLVEEEQAGKGRAEYGRRIVEGLAARLQAEFGRGFDRSNLFHMRAFFLAYPKVDAVRRQLSWTHYRLLRRVGNSQARAF